ncbi:Hypothetical predicted protein [Lecanosticta acicola]|uniref:Uncharacterized protein n=1 Tax=Lecanosticta acicola TaxID=111012 RepID=A0AAI8Z853_9PEZI|nr:Hypothetical predicted protein [Lecanosticta acicola]
MAQPSSSSDSGKCKLLELPAELRNDIYRLVLVPEDDAAVDIDANGYDRPGLLSTCKQIYYEARKIFYAENKFMFLVAGFDATYHAGEGDGCTGPTGNTVFL